MATSQGPVSVLPNWDAIYNCHSFALHEGQGDPNDPWNDSPNVPPHWDNDPADDLEEEDRLALGEAAEVGDIVVFGTDHDNDGVLDPLEGAHTGVVTEVDENGKITGVRGKFGDGPLYDHHPLDVPPIYGDVKGVYRPDPGEPGSSHQDGVDGTPNLPSSFSSKERGLRFATLIAEDEADAGLFSSVNSL